LESLSDFISKSNGKTTPLVHVVFTTLMMTLITPVIKGVLYFFLFYQILNDMLLSFETNHVHYIP
jgi:hypothetical protein